MQLVDLLFGYKYLKLIMTLLLASSQDSTAYGITYAVNDDFSIGYSSHTLEFDSGATNATNDQESTGISASYTMGGMTLAGAMNEVDNMDGVATATLKVTSSTFHLHSN